MNEALHATTKTPATQAARNFSTSIRPREAISGRRFRGGPEARFRGRAERKNKHAYSQTRTCMFTIADMHVHDYEYACSRLRICTFTIADMRVHKPHQLSGGGRKQCAGMATSQGGSGESRAIEDNRPYQLCVLCGSRPLAALRVRFAQATRCLRHGRISPLR